MKTDTHRDPIAVLTPAKRGNYVSRIDGPDSKWLAKRTKVKATTLDGTSIYRLEQPGIYEVQRGDSREWIASTGSELVTLDTFKMSNCPTCFEPLKSAGRDRSNIVRRMAKASVGPLYGEPGAYMSEQCVCGAVVESYDDDGFPRCEVWPQCKEGTA